MAPSIEEIQEEFLKVCENPCESVADKVGAFVRQGIDVNCVNGNGSTGVHLLAMNAEPSSSTLAAIRLLVANGADINAVDSSCSNVLHTVSRFDQSGNLLDTVQFLVGAGVRLHATCSGRWNALHLVCRFNETPTLLQVVRYLIDCGVDINATNDYRDNAMHILCRYNQSPVLGDVLQLLIDSGIDMNATNSEKWNALHLLCRYRSPSVTRTTAPVLVDGGIDVNAKTGHEWDCLHLLIRHNATDQLLPTVRYLVSSGADINSRRDNECNMMHTLCRYSDTDDIIPFVKYLLDNKVEMNRPDRDGFSPLTYCLRNNYKFQLHAIVEYLAEQRQMSATLSNIDQLILSIAKLGCAYLVRYFSNQVTLNVYDERGYDAVDYLQIVGSASFTLCPQCRQQSVALDTASLRRSLRSQYRHRLEAPYFSRRLLQQKMVRLIKDGDDEVMVNIPQNSWWRWLHKGWHENTVDVDSLLLYLDYNSQTFYRCPKLHSSSLCANCNWYQVLEHVQGYVCSAVTKAAELDDRFRSKRLVKYGTCFERTQIFYPSHFDYAVVMTSLAQCSKDSDSVIYTGTDDMTVFQSEQHTINSAKLLLYYSLLMAKVVERLYDVHIHPTEITFSETGITIHLVYRGKQPPTVKVTVAITLAVSVITRDGSQVPGTYLVPSRHGWQASSASRECDMLLTAGAEVTKCFQFLKLILALQHWTEGAGMVASKVHPTLDALKTCFLRYLREHDHDDWSEQQYIGHCCNVLLSFPVNAPTLASLLHPQVIVYEIDNGRCRNSIGDMVAKLRCVQQRTPTADAYGCNFFKRLTQFFIKEYFY